MRLPIGTKIYDEENEGQYWVIGDKEFIGFYNHKISIKHNHTLYPKWLDDSDWGYPWTIEYPKEHLFDKLYERMK